MVACPLSPALSDCDSLNGIEDLDAFLDAQGQLSHFPTPPLFALYKDDTIIQEVEMEFSDDEDELDSYRIAELFAGRATIGVEFNEIDVRMIQRMLLRAELPLEVLALALNILAGLDCHSLPLGSFHSAPNDLIVVTVLSLAVSYTSDFPPTPKYWSRHVCDGAWTPLRIDKTTLQVYAELGWRLHRYSAADAIRRTVDELTGSRHFSTLTIRSCQPTSLQNSTEFIGPEPVKLLIDGTTTKWENGQITPDGTPQDYSFVEVENRFLRLL